jgi:hypothetical protein
MEQGIVPKALICLNIDGLKDFEDFLLVEKADQGSLGPLLWYVEYPMGQILLFGIHKANHFGKGFKDRKPVIPGFGNVFALPLEIIEECDDQL